MSETEQQVPQISALAGALVSHQRFFDELSIDDRQWALQHPKDAIALFCEAIKSRVAKRTFTIDRSKPFDPVKFIGAGWSVLEEDKRSLSLNEIDLANVRFESGLNDGESVISGEEKLKRLKERRKTCLDAKLAQALYEEQGQATLRFLHDQFGVSWLELAGTVLRDSDGGRYFLVLRRRDGGSWGWCCNWLYYVRHRVHVSPLLAS